MESEQASVSINLNAKNYDNNNSQVIISNIDDKNYSLDELGKILGDMYEKGEDKVASVISFGLIYGGQILKNHFKASEIKNHSSLSGTQLDRELAKGINLYKSFLKNEFGLSFANENNVNELSEVSYNKIFYGIPGCGKSYHIEHDLLKNVKEENKFRTTFYLDYSNSDFIGQIYPSVTKTVDIDGNVISKVEYIRNPGPFTRALARAYETEEKVYLIIEEINRGNAAAIFGDLFQLLDRLNKKNEIDNRVVGDSEYLINNEFIEGYLKDKNILIPKQIDKIFIPCNLILYATMNTSDQNVFALDTAFKRRWDRERIVSSWGQVDSRKDMFIPGSLINNNGLKWKDFVDKINSEIVKLAENEIISEDKQIGPYFVGKEILSTYSFRMDTSNEKEIDKIKAFVNNVIDYLYNDVSKFDHKSLFNDDLDSYEKVYNNIINDHDTTYGLKCLKIN